VITSLIEDINSRDLIILDETTDGFSNEQLDKIRDIIHQLDTRQTIILSHEPKIESYVDNIIRIRKESGISQI
jgi:DNA repair exonuclease SbcCD ATPase subunit